MSLLRRWWSPQRLASLLVIGLVIYVTLWALHPSLLLSTTTVDGGDMGAHIATALYLHQTWSLPNLTPWDPGWFDGFPLYTYYFVLPDILAALGAYLIPFTVAFKLATVLGSLLMPITAYTMGRLFKAPHPIPAALAGATLPFLFDPTFTIDGGNLFSTLAGEYSFTLSLALALLTIGLFARGVRTLRGRWWVAAALALTLAAHVLPWCFALAVMAIVLVIELVAPPRGAARHHRRRVLWFAGTSGLLGVALSAWWLLPFATTQEYTTNVGYINFPTNTFRETFTKLGWYNAGGGVGADRWAIVLTAIGLVLAFVWLDRLGITLTLTAAAAAVTYVLWPQTSVWNARLVPFWFIAIYLSAGWVVGAVLSRLAARWSGALQRRRAGPAGPVTQSALAADGGRFERNTVLLAALLGGVGWYHLAGGVGGDWWFVALATVGLVTATWWWPRYWYSLLTGAVAATAVLVAWPGSRLQLVQVPPWLYVACFLAVGWLIGPARRPLVARWSSAIDPVTAFSSPQEAERETAALRGAFEVMGTYAVVVLTALSTVPGLIPSVAAAVGIHPGANQVTNWAAYNYEGYQRQTGWSEYSTLIDDMAKVGQRYGCGRAMWEYNVSEGRFGTTWALTLLPMWTNNCIDSEEGLLMESSATTPYHFMDQAELSEAPSDPLSTLTPQDYGLVNVPLGIKHLQLLGVRYYMAFTPAVVAAARKDPDLVPIAQTKVFSDSGVAWTIFLVKDSPLVAPLTYLPNVVANINGQSTWLKANVAWWLDPNKWDVPYAASGPADWPHTAHPGYVYKVPAGSTTVSDIVSSDEAISFNVSRVGVPVVVKISYYPRWHVSGGQGPYRISPDLMVVIPTSHHVTLTYGQSATNDLGELITALAMVAGVVALWRRRWWRRPRARYAPSGQSSGSDASTAAASSSGAETSAETVTSGSAGGS